MKSRCLNTNFPSYRNYGARGISICAEWVDDYKAFEAAVSPRPSKAHTIDRIDNERGYEPGNVRWALPREQARNTRRTRLNEQAVAAIRDRYASGGITQRQIALEYGVSDSTISHICNRRNWRNGSDEGK